MNEPKIFFDPTGRRRRVVTVVAILFALIVTAFIYLFLPKTLNNPIPTALRPASTAEATSEISLNEMDAGARSALVDKLRSQNLTVAGEGPLVRLVRFETNGTTTKAVDVQTRKATRTLTPMETQQVRGETYALERYGDTSGKRISLTFDDGPDPKYSPLILDELAELKIPASFFVTGKNVVKHGDIAERMVNEGHVLANHTYNHVNFSTVGSQVGSQEIIQTQRAIRSSTGYETSFFRIPYGGDNDQSMRDNLQAIVDAQRLGYIITSYDFDTNDWDPKRNGNIPMPDMTGNKDIVMLLHDSGGDRTNTIKYVRALAEEAKKNGYTFANLEQIYPQETPLFTPVSATLEDKLSLTTGQAVYVWPLEIIKLLFVLTVFSVIFGLVINTTLAFLQRRKSTFKRRSKNFKPLVTILIPAYNESTVIGKTVSSLLKSSYRNIEVIIINDGSTDDTRAVGMKLAKKSKRVRFISQRNAGKAAALNKGVAKAKGEIIICVDADTIFPAYTVSRLIKHFDDPKVGAVAGSVKVGNISNMVTRWQALEYTVSIHLERSAQAFLNSVMIVPGACGAWRKEAILAAGGYSHGTLAEDCDLTLSIQKAGYKVVQDNGAIGYTEAPDEIEILAKQRFRWIFGNMQSLWKHRDMIFKPSHGWLGLFVMPYAVFNTIMPIVFIPTLTLLALINIANGQYLTLLMFAGITLLIQFFASAMGVLLAKERLSLLLAVPFTRIVYSPIKTYLLYKSLLTMIRGSQVTWNKFGRTGAVATLLLISRQATKKSAAAAN